MQEVTRPLRLTVVSESLPLDSGLCQIQAKPADSLAQHPCSLTSLAHSSDKAFPVKGRQPLLEWGEGFLLGLEVIYAWLWLQAISLPPAS